MGIQESRRVLPRANQRASQSATPSTTSSRVRSTIIMMSTAVSTKAGVGSAASTRKVVVARRILGAASSRTASNVAGLRSALGRSNFQESNRSVKVFAGDDLKNTAQDLLTTATEKWEETEDKPTVVTLAF